MLAGVVTFTLGILMKFNCAPNSLGDYCKTVYRGELTTEGLEPYHLRLAPIADVPILVLN